MKVIKHLLLMTISGLLLLAGTSNAAEFTQRELAYMPASLQIELFKRGHSGLLG